MNWDDLRYFLAICRTGSLTAAGSLLGVNQTTVTRRLAALERQLDTRLFDRSSTGLILTDAGRDARAEAEAMEAHAQAIDREVFARDAAIQGRLSLTAPFDFAQRIFLDTLPEFRKSYPGIELDLITSSSLLDLAAREADLALRLTPSPPDYLVGRKLMTLGVGLYVAQAHAERLRSEPALLLFRGASQLPDWAVKYFPNAPVALRCDSALAIVEAIRGGLGIARLPCYLCDEDPQLCRIDLPLPAGTWGVWLLHHADLRTSARVRACRDFLSTQINNHRALIVGERSRMTTAAGEISPPG